MNAKTLIAAAVTLSAAGFSLAENGLPYTDYSKFKSDRSRADVVSVLQSGAATHTAANNEYHQFTTAGSTLTRADVHAHLEKDFAEGRSIHLANPEFIDYTQFASKKTRSQVRSEAFDSAKNINPGRQASGS